MINFLKLLAFLLVASIRYTYIVPMFALHHAFKFTYQASQFLSDFLLDFSTWEKEWFDSKSTWNSLKSAYIHYFSKDTGPHDG